MRGTERYIETAQKTLCALWRILEIFLRNGSLSVELSQLLGFFAVLLEKPVDNIFIRCIYFLNNLIIT